MSGISSVYRYTSVSEEDVEKIHGMNEIMHYRGLSDSELWHDTHFVAGEVFSITVTPSGEIISNEDGALILICDGTIYNSNELKNELKSKGHVFRTNIGEEVIVHLYEEYGCECLDHLRGPFAFCLYDASRQEVFVARDRMGEKTLYYSEIPCGVVFSTELKAILKAYVPSPQIDERQLMSPIRYTGPIDNEKTFIRQIKRLGPGEYLSLNSDGVKRFTYWNRRLLRMNRLDISLEDAKTRCLELLRESVRLCFDCDRPTAVMLSGGIDSSLVARLAKESGRDVHTITAGYAGSHLCDERVAARRFAEEQGFIHHEIELTEDDFEHCFDEFTQYVDEPVTDSAALAQWALFKKVRELGFDVLLGGMGGDEFFYGYPYWNALGKSYAVRREHEAIFPIKRHKMAFLKLMASNWKRILYANHPYEIADKSFCYWMRDDYYKFASDAVFTHSGKSYQVKDIPLNMPFPNVPRHRELDGVYDFQIDNIMTRAYLYLSDREGMGNSLEVRSPLIDHKLVEFVSRLPMEYKYVSGKPKWLLKEVLRGIVPDYILFASKKGFTPPSSFVSDVVDKYRYRFFDASYKFYNSVLTDRVCSLLFN